MATVAELKEQVCAQIDTNRDEIIQVAKTIGDNPEPGYREVKTSQLVAQKLTELGVPHRTGLALTGVKSLPLRGGEPGPTIAVFGEMDSLKVAGHVNVDPITGAAHACGHHAQIGMMLGVGIGLLRSDILPHLCGNVVLFAVPAEGGIENEFRMDLMDQGKIGFIGGKQELIRLDEFSDIDMAIMCHTTSRPEDRKLAVGGTSNGHVIKYIQYQGRAAHAGSAPHQGINALNAAMIALNAINTQRETFHAEDNTRVHGIITQGGTAVSSIPSDVRLEWRVRGQSVEAVERVNAQVDRCFRSGAQAVGARVRIRTIAGYLPLINNPLMAQVFQENAMHLVGEEGVAIRPDSFNSGGSTDMGDLSQLLPILHPYTSGAVGMGHGVDYVIEDYEAAVITPAKAMAMTVIDLLSEGAAGARRVLGDFKPSMTRDQYLALQQRRMRDELYEAKEE
ncbi:MAG: amidohydrolase [Chloroflexota bacterium]